MRIFCSERESVFIDLVTADANYPTTSEDQRKKNIKTETQRDK
jgi:hypothetical protein